MLVAHLAHTNSYDMGPTWIDLAVFVTFLVVMSILVYRMLRWVVRKF